MSSALITSLAALGTAQTLFAPSAAFISGPIVASIVLLIIGSISIGTYDICCYLHAVVQHIRKNLANKKYEVLLSERTKRSMNYSPLAGAPTAEETNIFTLVKSKTSRPGPAPIAANSAKPLEPTAPYPAPFMAPNTMVKFILGRGTSSVYCILAIIFVGLALTLRIRDAAGLLMALQPPASSSHSPISIPLLYFHDTIQTLANQTTLTENNVAVLLLLVVLAPILLITSQSVGTLLRKYCDVMLLAGHVALFGCLLFRAVIISLTAMSTMDDDKGNNTLFHFANLATQPAMTWNNVRASAQFVLSSVFPHGVGVPVLFSALGLPAGTRLHRRIALFTILYMLALMWICSIPGVLPQRHRRPQLLLLAFSDGPSWLGDTFPPLMTHVGAYLTWIPIIHLIGITRVMVAGIVTNAEELGKCLFGSTFLLPSANARLWVNVGVLLTIGSFVAQDQRPVAWVLWVCCSLMHVLWSLCGFCVLTYAVPRLPDLPVLNRSPASLLVLAFMWLGAAIAIASHHYYY